MMSGTLRAIAMIAPAAMFVASVAGAQPSSPTGLASADSASGSSTRHRDRCRSASPIAALDEHERVAVLCLDSLELAGIHDVTDLLSSRIPGVLVQETSGTTGTAARIRIRGPGSILLDAEPLFVLDGVRIFGTPARSSLLAPQLPSRLDDIDVDDIATVEVLRGPATSAMYGVGTAGGVIRITTKRGAAGPARVHAFAEAGAVIEPTRFPSNYSQPGTATSTGLPTLNCTLDARARGACTANESEMRSFSPLEEVSQFRRGLRQSYGASVSGGAQRLGYYAGAGYSNENGVLEDSDLARKNVRLNLDARPLDEFGISLSSAYLVADAQFPKGDSHYRGVIVNGLLGSSQDDPDNRGYLSPPDSLKVGDNRQDVTRLNASASAHWTPSPWIQVEIGIGVDQVDTDDLERLPSILAPWGEIRTTGEMHVDKETAGLSIAGSYPVGSWIHGSTQVGFDRNETDFEQSSRTDDGSGFGSSFRSWSNLTSEGFLVRQRFTWLDRVSFEAGLRSDDFDFGTVNTSSQTSRSAALSWTARRETQGGGAVGALSFHLAYGDVPGATNSMDIPLVILPPFTPDRPAWKSERTAEFEGGFVSSFFRERLHLSLTAYRKKTRNAFAMIYDPLYGDRIVGNGAEVRNTGVEGMVTAAVVDTRAAKLGLDVGIWSNSNKVGSLERGPNYLENGAWQQHAGGYPLAGYWQRRIVSYEDIDGDGTISRVNCPGQPEVAGGPVCEIDVGTSYEYLGSPNPRLEMFFAPRLTLFDRIRVSALLDYRSGFKQFNQTEASRCGTLRCRGAIDPTAPLDEQARVIAAISGITGGFDADGGWVEDATFTKLREVAVSLTLPESSNRMIGRPITFTIAGRNLATWTDYSGLDPEISGSGPLGFAQAETFTQPLLRYYTARVSVGGW